MSPMSHREQMEALEEEAERLYLTDPVFHARAYIGAQVLIERSEEQYTHKEWWEAKLTASVMLLAMTRTLNPAPPPPFNNDPLDPQAQHYKEWVEKEDENEA